MTSPALTFGRHRGQTTDQLPDDYVRWPTDPTRAEPQAGGTFQPLPHDVVATARERLKSTGAAKLREKFARMCLGGHPTGMDAPIFVIECDGDCHSRSGTFAIDNQWFRSLGETLAYLASEFPILAGSRVTPDPENDLIAVWEVLPSGHRKVVWRFFGCHFSQTSENAACGQGSLPGDDASLYDLAMRDR